MNRTAAIILAAGKGTRLKSSNHRNKVAHSLADKPIIAYTVASLRRAKIHTIIAVVGYAKDSVKKALDNQIIYAEQAKRLGTGHAVKVGLKQVPSNIDTVISLYGDDSAFYPPKLINQVLSHHRRCQAAITLLTINKTDPTGLGRIIRDSQGQFTAIVEEKNATPAQKQITEINTGLFCFNRRFLDKYITTIKKNPISKEYYLTDIVEIAINHHQKVTTLHWPDESIWFGVNTTDQLKAADQLMRQKTHADR